MRLIASLLVLLGCLTTPVLAHEFWISPVDYQVAPGEALHADLRIGSDFIGYPNPNLPNQTERFEIWQADTVTPYGGRLGDRPALQLDGFEQPGLVTLVHETSDTNLTYTEWSKFTDFCTHKDFAWAIDRHLARGFPQTEFVESYRRFAKSLIAVGDGAGADQVVGLEVEIIALTNPYTVDPADGVLVEVRYQDQPMPDVQVELFGRRLSDNSLLETTYYRTDAQGRVTLPVEAGVEYLVDHVEMLEQPGTIEDRTPVWRSLWASLTFVVPG